MPKEIINYSSTIIYKIVCKDLNITDIYVGHTTNFIKRKAQHKSACKNPSATGYNSKVYSTIRDNGNWENWDMIEIEKFNCNDRNEAAARERYWYETLHAKLNSDYPNRTKKECNKNYRINNIEKIALKKQEYYNNNKEKISLKGNEYRINNREKKKEYHINNKEKINEKTREYYINNKEKIKEYKNKKHICEICGGNYSNSCKSRHEKTILHMSKLDEIK